MIVACSFLATRVGGEEGEGEGEVCGVCEFMGGTCGFGLRTLAVANQPPPHPYTHITQTYNLQIRSSLPPSTSPSQVPCALVSQEHTLEKPSSHGLFRFVALEFHLSPKVYK
jgi:hypothetical protein